jgi:hypothetical protein
MTQTQMVLTVAGIVSAVVTLAVVVVAAFCRDRRSSTWASRSAMAAAVVALAGIMPDRASQLYVAADVGVFGLMAMTSVIFRTLAASWKES